MKTSFDITVEKMKQFCIYRERSHQEVRNKLLNEKVYGDELEEMMGILIEENFLSEERFAIAFVTGKFRQNHWGRNKIRQELKRFNVSEYCTKKGFEALDDKEYAEVIQNLWDKKMRTLTGGNTYTNKQKILQYLIGKGFEYEIVKELMM